MNTANGTFASQAIYSVGTFPTPIVAADVNGDNKCDMIVGNFISNNVGVLLNAGNGTLLTQTTYPTGSNPRAVAVNDVNNDNKLDIVVTNYGSTNIGVLINAGNGTFLSETNYASGSSPISVATGDVNNDNQLDIVVANYGSANFITYDIDIALKDILNSIINLTKEQNNLIKNSLSLIGELTFFVYFLASFNSLSNVKSLLSLPNIVNYLTNSLYSIILSDDQSSSLLLINQLCLALHSIVEIPTSSSSSID
ncbi:unnamed protein product [Adineta steineri]|nr:unnamed protein product [Adineta steineri]